MKSPRRLTMFIFVVIVAPLLTGCGNGLASLSGTVLINGKPAPEGVSLQFQPTFEGGSPSYAMTDKEGKYTAQFTFKSAGIQPGEHNVFLIPGAVKTPMPVIGPDGNPVGPPPTNPMKNMPRSYYESITLIEVESGSNEKDIQLTTE